MEKANKYAWFGTAEDKAVHNDICLLWTFEVGKDVYRVVADRNKLPEIIGDITLDYWFIVEKRSGDAYLGEVQWSNANYYNPLVTFFVYETMNANGIRPSWAPKK